MKNGTMYATKLKKAYGKIRHGMAKPEIPEPDDPIQRMAIAFLGLSGGDEEGKRLVDLLMSGMVDWNEVRVSRPFELCRAIGDNSALMLKRCQQLVSALNAIYQLEHRPSLERLKGLGRREAKQYLDKLAGVDDYVSASVNLWSLGGHSIPIHDALLEVLRANDWVEPSATRAEVQAFLERNISAVEAKEFCLVMNAYAEQSGSGRGKGRSAKASVDA